jgi:hypothetical protein
MQEVQFEPVKVVMAVEGDIPDDVDMKEELALLGKFLENSVYDQLERMLT